MPDGENATTTKDAPASSNGSARAWALLTQQLRDFAADLRQERQATSQAQTALWKRSDQLAKCLGHLETEVARLWAAVNAGTGAARPKPTLRDWAIAVAAVIASIAFLVAAVRGLVDLPSCIAAVLKTIVK